MRHMRRSATGWAWRSLPLPLVLALTLLAAGCSGGGGGGGDGQAKAESQAQPTTATATTAPPVVASADKGDLPGIALTINQLRRSDPNTVTLIFTIANQGDKPFTFDWTWGELGFVRVGDAL